ncbi:MAG: metallophosphoesterase [Ignavibacteriae bacterium]|nr:metallophosphoesterase [Ignavibacteriota bacterium]
MNSFERIKFFLIVFSVIFALQSLSFYQFRRFLKKRSVKKAFTNLITIIPFVVFNIPFVWMIFRQIDFSLMPKWLFNIYILPFFVFQSSVFFISIYILAGKVIKLIINIPVFVLKRFKTVREKIASLKTKKSVIQYDKSRRAFLTTSAAVVSGYAFIGAGMGVIGKDRYEITYSDIKIYNLPDELKGTTITLFSDIHSGPFMDEDMMKEYCQVVNSLNSDLILIPGDLTNSLKSEIHPFTNAFRDLKAKYGVYSTLGNHDYFHDYEYIYKALANESPIKMLRNESAFIKIKEKEICLMGLEDIPDSGAKKNNIIVNYLNETIEKTDYRFNRLPKILLCHKPYVFDRILDKKIDLVLSGHTHGGQIVFAKFGNVNLSIAASISNYISGVYTGGDTNMYVSRGIGTVGFPMRLNCPPEITQIRLV